MERQERQRQPILARDHHRLRQSGTDGESAGERGFPRIVTGPVTPSGRSTRTATGNASIAHSERKLELAGAGTGERDLEAVDGADVTGHLQGEAGAPVAAARIGRAARDGDETERGDGELHRKLTVNCGSPVRSASGSAITAATTMVRARPDYQSHQRRASGVRGGGANRA